jgi:putative component of membrane protein insertase Oxa1/YidC/SpoIIIJ protein YidD
MRKIPDFRLRNLVLAAALAASTIGFAATFSGRFSPALCRTAIAAIQFYQQRLHPYTHPFVRCRLRPTCSAFALQKFKCGKFAESVVAVAERLSQCARTPVAARPLAPQVPLAVIAAASFQRNDQDAAAGAACCAGLGA